jgi:hypothetical protein
MRVMMSDSTKITEILLPFDTYINFFYSIFDKIVSIVISDSNNSHNSNKGLKLAIKLIKDPKGWIFHTDQGVETVNELVEDTLNANGMVRSNTDKTMNSKKWTEPINAKFEKEVIYNHVKHYGARECWSLTNANYNLKMLIKWTREWVYKYNNTRNFKMNATVKATIESKAKEYLQFYKGSTKFQANEFINSRSVT